MLYPSENSHIVDICSGNAHNLLLKSTGKVYAIGRNDVSYFKILQFRKVNLVLVTVLDQHLQELQCQI
jgi:alpha-tubulin suppressor-like RCC1 family protein